MVFGEFIDVWGRWHGEWSLGNTAVREMGAMEAGKEGAFQTAGFRRDVKWS